MAFSRVVVVSLAIFKVSDGCVDVNYAALPSLARSDSEPFDNLQRDVALYLGPDATERTVQKAWELAYGETLRFRFLVAAGTKTEEELGDPGDPPVGRTFKSEKTTNGKR